MPGDNLSGAGSTMNHTNDVPQLFGDFDVNEACNAFFPSSASLSAELPPPDPSIHSTTDSGDSSEVNHLAYLFRKARTTIASMTQTPAYCEKLLLEVQKLMSSVEKVFKGTIRIHVIAQSKHGHILPLYSQSMLYAFTQEYRKVTYAVCALSDTLKYSDEALKLVQQQPRRQSTPISTVAVPKPRKAKTTKVELPSNLIGLPVPRESWFPGPIISKDLSVFSTRIIFDSTPTSRSSAIVLQQQLEDESNTLANDLDLSQPPMSFSVHDSDRTRVIFCRDDVYDAMKSLNRGKLGKVWSTFFNSLNQYGLFNYEYFNPQWLDERSRFIIGSTGQVVTPGGKASKDKNKLSVVHDFRCEQGRCLAKCILTTWLHREPNTRVWLAEILGAEGVQLPPDLLESRYESTPQIVHSAYTLSKEAMYTLNPYSYASDAVLNAFLYLVSDEKTVILSTDFFYHLVSQSWDKLARWCISDRFDINKVERIVIPMHDWSTKHWAISVISKEEKDIKLYDVLNGQRIFLPIYPKLLLWANSLSFVYNGGGWSKQHRISEESMIATIEKPSVDSSILMCYHAFLVARKQSGGMQYRVDTHRTRKRIAISLQTGLCVDLVRAEATQQAPVRQVESSDLQHSNSFHLPSSNYTQKILPMGASESPPLQRIHPFTPVSENPQVVVAAGSTSNTQMAIFSMVHDNGERMHATPTPSHPIDPPTRSIGPPTRTIENQDMHTAPPIDSGSSTTPHNGTINTAGDTVRNSLPESPNNPPPPAAINSGNNPSSSAVENLQIVGATTRRINNSEATQNARNTPNESGSVLPSLQKNNTPVSNKTFEPVSILKKASPSARNFINPSSFYTSTPSTKVSQNPKPGVRFNLENTNNPSTSRSGRSSTLSTPVHRTREEPTPPWMSNKNNTGKEIAKKSTPEPSPRHGKTSKTPSQSSAIRKPRRPRTPASPKSSTARMLRSAAKRGQQARTPDR